MRSSQTVYLTADRKKAVPENDKGARFLLVREGQEIHESKLAGIEGAEDLVGAKAKKAAHKEEEPKKTAAKH